MCGLIGIVNRETVKYNSDNLVKVFSQGLYCDALRGKHGTGIMGVDGKGYVSVYKRALASADFLELKNTIKIIDDPSNIFLMGHNRYATQGGHTSDNTHPFSHSNIHLFHNGTLDSFRNLNPGKTFTVDSDALAYYIATSNNVSKSLEEIEGAFSLVWYDESEETLNFARNKERPMYFGLIKNSTSFIYASEADMISWLAGRNGIILDKIISTSIGKLISIPLDWKEKTILTEFTPKEPKVIYYNNSYNRGKGNINGGLVVTSSGKYDHLKGKEIVIEAENWTPYGSNSAEPNIFGQFKCKYDEKLTINVSSINKNLVSLYQGHLIVVEIVSISSDELAYSRLIRLANDEDIIDMLSSENEETDESEFELTVEELEERISNKLVIKGPKGRLISLAEYSEKTKNGCMHCCKTINVNDAPGLLWDSNEVDVLCPECKRLYVQ